jgi:hypothetical protein
MKAPFGILPAGLSFDIPQLLIVLAWAEFHDLRLEVELDYSVDGEDYEEVLALYNRGSSARRWLIWRSPTEIVVQPLLGRACRFASIAEALESLFPAASDPVEPLAPRPQRAPRARRRVPQ